MTYQSAFGHEEGIAQRLIAWRRALGMNKNYPWLGTGICDDLVTAARMLGGDVSEFEKDANQPDLPMMPSEPTELEFDL